MDRARPLEERRREDVGTVRRHTETEGTRIDQGNESKREKGLRKKCDGYCVIEWGRREKK